MYVSRYGNVRRVPVVFARDFLRGRNVANQQNLFRADFDGHTYARGADYARLASLLERVKTHMLDERWHTLSDIQQACGGSVASCSARLRDLRKEKFGGYQIEHERLEDGLWRYRLVRG